MVAGAASARPHPVVVLGAGCAGLMAGLTASRRGLPVLVLEKEAQPGGLAVGVTVDGTYYDKGPHIFHSRDQRLVDEIRSLVGNELREIQRTISIKYFGRYFRFPLALGEVLGQLPRATVLRAGMSFLWHRTLGSLPRPPVETTETVLVRSYGRTLYRIFFEEYIRNVWGIPAGAFSPQFATTRIPRMSVLELLSRFAPGRGSTRAAVDTSQFVEKVEGTLYSTPRGFAPIAERMLEAIEALGGKVELGAEATRVRMQGGRAVEVEYRTREGSLTSPCHGLVNTLPLRVVTPLLDPQPSERIRQAAEGLGYRAMVFVGLVVRRSPVLPSALLYIRDQPFNRVSDLGQLGFPAPLAGGSAVVAEITCDPSDTIWRDQELAKKTVLEGLAANGLLSPDEVAEAHVYRAEHAYPIYRLGFEDKLEAILDFFGRSSNMETTGRQGCFAYVNMHIAMTMGAEAVQRLLDKLAG